jgi:hypothetical protein
MKNEKPKYAIVGAEYLDPNFVWEVDSEDCLSVVDSYEEGLAYSPLLLDSIDDAKACIADELESYQEDCPDPGYNPFEETKIYRVEECSAGILVCYDIKSEAYTMTIDTYEQCGEPSTER